MWIEAVFDSVKGQIGLMMSTTAGDGKGVHGHAIKLGGLERAAVPLSSLCYSGVGVMYGWAGDVVGQHLFIAVGIVSAIADGDLFEQTPLESLAGVAHILDRWLATTGGCYFLIPRLSGIVAHWEDRLAIAALLLSTSCLAVARKQEDEREWAKWQILWHILSAGSMCLFVSRKADGVW